MAEDLTTDDLESYAGLPADEDETARVLAAALARCRRYCGWHVSPQIEQTLILDGTGSDRIVLPTQHVAEITAATVDGVDVLADIKSPQYSSAVLYLSSGWTRGYGNVEIALTHGYAAEDAADFREAVLRMAAEAARIADSGGDITAVTVDDVTTRWSRTPGMEPGVAATLDPFRRKWFAV